MVYVISDGSGFVKIGKAVDVNKRIKDLQAGNPRQLELIFAFSTFGAKCDDHGLESDLHRIYDCYRVKTIWKETEWFSEVVLNTIQDCVSALLGGKSVYEVEKKVLQENECLLSKINRLERYNLKLQAENNGKALKIKELQNEVNRLTIQKLKVCI